jgi:hypothetical protein
MEPMTDYPQSFPPPPPPNPKRSHKGLWIGLGIAIVLLCLCCIALVAGVYFFRINVPVISNFFPSPTPAGLLYYNPSAGISVTYPLTWQYSEFGDANSGFTIILASSADLLNDTTNSVTTGAIMEIYTNALRTSDIPFPVNAGSMGDVVDYIATQSTITQGPGTHIYTVSGLPAASGIYTMPGAGGMTATAYLIAILRTDEIIVIAAVCPQTEWSQYQPAFDSIINSAVIATP